MTDPNDIRSGGPGGDQPASDIKLISIVDEMKRSYLDYAMSVIVSRALP
ncbi:MAG: gyrase subunit, partial [Microvirga sp.]|nr:gyrase subunit [Microvirga sp.]